MIQAICYSKENSQKKEPINVKDISDHISDPSNHIWVDIENATKEELDSIAHEFNIHELSIEDSLKSFQRPKLEQYDNYLFIVLHGVDYIPEKDQLVLREIDIFLGLNFIITVRNENSALFSGEEVAPYPIEILISAWDEQRSELKVKGSSMIFYTIADALVDRYFKVNDMLEDKLDRLEDIIFQSFDDKSVMEGIYKFKKDLLTYRRVVAPLKDVVHTVTSREIKISNTVVFDFHSILYFQDIYDHTIRIHEAIDTYRDLLTSALEVQLSMVSNQLNEIMKKLTSIAAIIAVPTLIVGVYGMNFKFMPELHMRYGYFVVLAFMLLVSGLIAYYFRKNKWF